MTHIERTHILAPCKRFGINPMEIDDSLTYGENRRHVSEREQREWATQYKQYLDALRKKLEGAGYVVKAPDM